jgi:serine/threonine protein kinase
VVKIFYDSYIKGSTRASKEIQTEVDILSELVHPNLNLLLDHGMDGYIETKDKQPYFEIAYVRLSHAPVHLLGDLKKAAGRFAEPGSRYLMKQLIDAVKYMHDQGIVHRDL